MASVNLVIMYNHFLCFHRNISTRDILVSVFFVFLGGGIFILVHLVLCFCFSMMTKTVLGCSVFGFTPCWNQ